MENIINIDNWGVPLFLETPISPIENRGFQLPRYFTKRFLGSGFRGVALVKLELKKLETFF